VIADVSHQDLADAIGVHRETVTKILDEFEAAGLVALGGGRVQVLKGMSCATVAPV
jgi:CRP-like cAMP-binding protein